MGYISLVSILLLLISACSTAPSYKEETLKALGQIEVNQSQSLTELTRLCGLGNRAACALSNSDYEMPSAEFAVVQGATTETQTQVSLLAKNTEKLQFFLVNRGNGELAKLSRSEVKTWPKSPWQVHRLVFSDLVVGHEYALAIIDHESRLRDLRLLKAFDPKKNTSEIFVASCMDDNFKKVQSEMWTQVEEDLNAGKFEVAFLIGDNVYADKGVNIIPGPATADQVWRRYAETLNRLKFYKFRKLVPSFFTWDDHDYGWNNGDSSYAYRNEAQKIFKSFWPVSEMPGFYKAGPGVSSFVGFAGQNFFFLDDRSFRSANNQSSGSQEHFGEEQLDWLFKEIKRSPRPTWLISGDQFFGAYHPFESFEGNHPKAFSEFKKKIKRLKVPVIFVSGDRHLTEVMKIDKKEVGYQTYELTSSGMHAKVYPGSFQRDPNPRQLVGKDGTFNYMYISSKTLNSKSIDFKVKSWGPKTGENPLIFEKELRVKK